MSGTSYEELCDRFLTLTRAYHFSDGYGDVEGWTVHQANLAQLFKDAGWTEEEFDAEVERRFALRDAKVR